MKRPFAMVALLYASGLWLGDRVTLPFTWLFALSFGLALVACASARARPWLIWPLLFCTGLTGLTFHKAILSPGDLRLIMGSRVEEVVLRGTLVETPTHRVYELSEKESWRTVAWVDVEALRLGRTDWQNGFGRVAVSTTGIVSDGFFGGQSVEIIGVLRQPKGAVAEGLFDYRQYLSRLGIYYQLQVGSANDWRRLSTERSPPFPDRFGVWARRILALGLPIEDEPLRLLWAMTLGWKTALNGEVAEPFMRSGTMHIFAISGLHIALMAGILVALLRVCRLPRGWCGWLVIPLLWLYTYATGWQASAIRSTIMMSVIIIGWSLNRPGDLLNSLAAAALIILIWDPQQLFQASFQLSFFVVLSIALFAPLLVAVRQRLLRVDPMLPAELVPRWQRWLRQGAHWLGEGFCTSLAAWLGSIPLVAYYFHFLTPVSLLANVVVVPLSSAALAGNLASLLVGEWLPGMAGCFNNAAWLLMVLMVRMSEWAAGLPGGCFHVATPGILTFVLYYGVLISWVAGWLKKPVVGHWVTAGLALLALAWLVQWRTARAVTRLSILPLSGGEAIYCDAPGGLNDLLIDCGSESAARFTTKPFLRARGVNSLPGLLLTHGDLRQVGGAALVQEQFSAGRVYYSPVRFRSTAYREVRDKFEAIPELSRIIQRGDRLGQWTVLHPAAEDRSPQADDNAVVLRAEIDGVRVLLLSDLGKPGQNLLMAREPDLRAEIVVSGLPVQTEPVAEPLLDAIQPRVLIVTDSEFPATARAGRKLRQRLSGRSFPVLFTLDTGAITLAIHKKQWKITSAGGLTITSQELAAASH